MRADLLADEIVRLPHSGARSGAALQGVLAPGQSAQRRDELAMGDWELGMLQWPSGRTCERSPELRAMAHRVRQWSTKPERCSHCRQQAVGICAGRAFCLTCRAQRDSRVRTRRAVTKSTGTPDALRVGAAGDRLVGHAIVFNTLSVDLGGFRERIRPEAVDRVLTERTDLRGLWNHDSSLPIGRVSAGTLAIRKDARGLVAEIDPPAHAGAYVESVRRGDVRGMSFAFRAIEDDWRLDGETVIREIADMAINEVSAVTFPAYPSTDINVRAAREGTGRSVALAHRQLLLVR